LQFAADKTQILTWRSAITSLLHFSLFFFSNSTARNSFHALYTLVPFSYSLEQKYKKNSCFITNKNRNRKICSFPSTLLRCCQGGD